MPLQIDPSEGDDFSRYSANEQTARKIEEHDHVVQVKDTMFAAALASIGVPLFDPPCVTREFGDGRRETTWRFQVTDAEGEIDVRTLLPAAYDPLKWIRENPDHVLTFALAAILNLQIFQKGAAEGRAMVSFKLDGRRHIHVMKGSRKERLLRRQGYEQI